ncbi:MAG: small ribosomal subunit Rsm22 family protein [Oscillospiraceae bacterium]|nr:small ribosomal subunit Rsm22 family protein [Oscillospiraceae bacterium]
MEFPLPLRMSIEQKAQDTGTASLTKEAQDLSLRYRGESGHGKRLVTSDRQALAYAAVRMPATFGAVASALEHTLPLLARSPATLLDVGAGTGAACWAADALLDLESVVCLEREPYMAQLGQALMAGGPAALQNARWLSSDIAERGPLPRAQLVAASYVLGEMRPEERPAALSRLWDAAESLLLLVEPGTPEGFRQLKEARAFLLGQKAVLLAPCPHENACPLPPDDWCHFTCRVARSRLHRQLKGGEAPYEDEKFCYLAFSREKAPRAAARILRHPQIESGRITLRLCTPDRIGDLPVRKRDGSLFKAARKANCGDAFPSEI